MTIEGKDILERKKMSGRKNQRQRQKSKVVFMFRKQSEIHAVWNSHKKVTENEAGVTDRAE